MYIVGKLACIIPAAVHVFILRGAQSANLAPSYMGMCAYYIS